MAIIGAVLIALGISAIFDFNVWPFLIIAAGIAYLWAAIFRSANSSLWTLPACCYPAYWFTDDKEDEAQKTD
jgi:sulfite exporter TauE/SafE